MGYKLCSAESAIATCDSYNWPHKKKTKPRPRPPLRRFTYVELETATNAFSTRDLLGKGSHGAVYRAVLDKGSLIVAVKRPNGSATLAAENEIDILSRINNDRIVNLVGYTDAISVSANHNSSKLLLVVEHMPNGSLYDLIHAAKPHNSPLTWSTRVRIALQIARAIRTLHISNPPVIHRDIKSSNILLDGKFRARLSDFGLALSGHVDDMRVLSTPPAGTLGYLDPCYLAPCDVSTKNDVFSFGILLLEIISGRRAIDVNYSPPAIIEWALPLVKAEDYQGICDRRIPYALDRTVAKELGLLAARCVRSTAQKRPSMNEVVTCLKNVYKRVKFIPTVPIWRNLGQRVRHIEKHQPLDENKDSEDPPRVMSMRSLASRTRRKVSNVPTVEDNVEEIRTCVEHRLAKLKSKSVGSSDDCEIIKVNNGKQVVKVKVKNKMCNVVRLSKSRSMSVLQSSTNVNHVAQVKELDVFPLLVKSSSCKSP